ncbi:MAG: FAD-dependent monooxygenase [Thermoleophilia bacterium]|nr:FAD-dependent monooxygenase [Thermoleophilia bacterium]
MNVSNPSTDRVVVVGAGPAGMATAIELAQRGVPSVVLEKRGAVATREPLFNVVPALADRLAALDPDGSLTRLLVPTDAMHGVDKASGARRSRTFDGPLAPDPTRSRGDMESLLRGSGSPEATDADRRRWSMVGIGDLENGLRELARTKHADLIELRTDAGVESIRQGDGFAEAVLAPTTDGAVRDAVRGAFLIDASGRDLLGGPRTTYPEQGWWLGTRLQAPADGAHATLKLRDRTVSPQHSTIKLPSADRTIVWTQVDRPPTEIPPDEARSILQERARDVGIDSQLPQDAPIMPVTVQLWTSDEPARGRVLKVGDSVRAPYFMTSTGAATALVHDVPRAVDAIMAVRDGADLSTTVGGYADAVRSANEALVAQVRPTLLGDLGIRPGDAGAPIASDQPPAG